ncbi:hypothetical protein PghCCS26_18950 [Paenibacillus glycanilyticus]|uniref:Uncharacterized protein n=1 Tax=Paenibacillus glycanilyticus TaxID=126569 RepID=A0ABQ6NKN7_9BACL|nr:hypothetical protein [Paenibacillus glycanilyticus]GMK44767.1 hypothetical protein PghCCS26_18950 [Paenibacillus glycanilyticus]
MIGTWHAMLESNGANNKYIFTIEENEGGLQLLVQTEPNPFFNEPMQAITYGNHLTAIGRSSFFPDAINFWLLFEEDSFSGTMELSIIGELKFHGRRGRGPSLANQE